MNLDDFINHYISINANQAPDGLRVATNPPGVLNDQHRIWFNLVNYLRTDFLVSNRPFDHYYANNELRIGSHPPNTKGQVFMTFALQITTFSVQLNLAHGVRNLINHNALTQDAEWLLNNQNTLYSNTIDIAKITDELSQLIKTFNNWNQLNTIFNNRRGRYPN
jgi:hypothetical protein